MSITLTSSQAALVAQAGVEHRTLVSLGTAYGTQDVATELTRWSGVDYAGMLAEPPTISVPLGNPGTGQLATKSITITLHNPDGFWSKRPSSHYRGQTITTREVLLGVESTALRTATFRATATRMPAGGATFIIDGEDAWVAARRTLVPSNNVLFDTRKYPNMSGLDGIGTPIPVVFGRRIVPLTLVDDHSSGYWRYAACVGTATLIGSGAYYELSDERLKPIATASGTNYDVFSLQYAVRNGVPVTEFVTTVSPYQGAGPIPRFADLVCNSPGHPDQVLLGLATDSVWGAALPASLINSASLLEARSFYLANSLTFDCALTAQRPLEDWIGDWTHDAMTGILARDQLVLAHQGSRTAQASLSPANILLNTMEYTDGPEAQEDSHRVLTYVERSARPDVLVVVEWVAGSGSTLVRTSPFIGRGTVARRVVQYWAKEGAAAVRTYALRTTLRTAGLEEGDLAVLTHAIVNADQQLTRVAHLDRTDGIYGVGLRRTEAAAWDPENLGTDVPFLQQFRVVGVPYTGSGTNLVTFSATHLLGSTPVSLVLKTGASAGYGVPTYTASLATATDSTFSVAIQVTPSTANTAPVYGGNVQGFNLFANPALWGE